MPWRISRRPTSLTQTDKVAQVLSLAQQTADQAVADAEAQAAKIVDAAREDAARIIAEARHTADTGKPD